MIECVRYTPINKSTCLGLATVFVPKWGVEITGISLHEKNGKRWVNLPSKLVEEGEEKKYYPYVRFRDRELKDKFCELVKQAIDTHIASHGDTSLDEEVPF